MKQRLAACSVMVCLLASLSANAEFGFDDVVSLAQARSRKPYHATTNYVPNTLLNLNYAQYSVIHFDDQKALWRSEGLPFCLEFFLPGYLHKEAVSIYEIDPQAVREIPFDPSLFDNPDHNLKLAGATGYAGFRIEKYHGAFSEFAAFMDASYFRMIGYGENYGSSARGLALYTASSRPEEFPVFQQFWFRRPKKGDQEITLYALMDSPSVAGAFQFIIRPGNATVSKIKEALFPRVEITEAGLAPLTSMYLFGENGHPPFGDFRPQAHDVDGLQIHNSHGEWIWRPLYKGRMIRIDAFMDENPPGFGLVQRDRNFATYQDLDARFQLRPNVWVQPVGQWGKGSVELVELPSETDAEDNIVAFWRPAEPLEAGRRLDLEYELHWTTKDPLPPELGFVKGTYIGVIKEDQGPEHVRFVVEYAGPPVDRLTAKEKPTADINYGPGTQPVTYDLFKNEYDQSWRLVLEIVQPRAAVNLRAALRWKDRPITETWNLTWQP